jgi:hypothetical protein
MLLQAHALARVWVLRPVGLCGGGLRHGGAPHDPFFTSSAMPLVQAWRPFWVLWLAAAAGMQVLAAWLEWGGIAASPAGPHGRWCTARCRCWWAVFWCGWWVWGLVQSLKNKLLAMLHIGFLWLGVAFLLGGLAQWLAVGLGASLGLGALHALSMGCLASLMLAMVTRVSWPRRAGAGGRPHRVVAVLPAAAGHLAAHCSHLASVASGRIALVAAGQRQRVAHHHGGVGRAAGALVWPLAPRWAPRLTLDERTSSCLSSLGPWIPCAAVAAAAPGHSNMP